jgi:hypothetical protein
MKPDEHGGKTKSKNIKPKHSPSSFRQAAAIKQKICFKIRAHPRLRQGPGYPLK